MTGRGLPEVVLPVRGMSCQKCVAKLTAALSGQPGVESSRISLQEGTATVRYDAEVIGRQDLVSAVEEAGFRVAERPAQVADPAETPDSGPQGKGGERLSLAIRGMTCANCARTIEKRVGRLPGVSRTAVNFSAEKLNVEFDPQRLDRDTIAAAVHDAGYIAVTAEEATGEGEEARRALRWVLFAAALSLPIMPLMWLRPFGSATLPVIAALATVVQFSAGLTFYRGAWKSLKNRAANMDVLVAMGISAAWGYSLLAAGGLFGGADEVFFETGAMLVTFIRFGKWLEARAKGRAGEALRKLLRLQADRATLLVGEEERCVTASAVRVGDRVVVRPGERVPVDGVIEDGEAALDESMLTGEALPAAKGPGETVTGATVNRSGRLVVRATAVGEETVLAQIVRMVEEAQGDKAPIQRLADAVANWFVPAVVAIAAVTFCVWYLLVGEVFLFAFKMAIAVLVIACPCALGLATPTAIMVGSAVGLNAGILFKRASALENVSRLEVLLLDKTGTLTTGEFTVTALVPLPGYDERSLLRLAAAAENASGHPLARAVVGHARRTGVDFPGADGVTEVGGHGLLCTVEGRRVLAGNRRLMEREGVSVAGAPAEIDALAASGASVVYVAQEGRLAGLVALSDTLKEGTAEAVARLKELGLRTVMVTGDRRQVAEAAARQAGIDAVEAEVLPGDKRQVVERHQQVGCFVGMVGDGINDAPALAQADIGIAIGSGTDVAKETGDIILVGGDVRDVERSIRLGRWTLAKIRQNLFWAFFYNVVGIPLAAGLFYPAFGLSLRPEYAGLAMAFSSVSVVSNSLLLRRRAAKL